MQLIKIEARQIAGATIQTCNARDLWQFVESKQDFSTWIKGRIEKYGFVEGEDYVIHKFMDNPLGGRPTLDYHLTIETAKELAMVENNDKGREVRRYFIECERRAAQPIDLNDPAFLRGTLLTYTEKLLEAQAVISEQAPKVAALDRLSSAEGLFSIRDTAKVIGVQERILITWLLEHNWLYRAPATTRLCAYAKHIQAGHLKVIDVLSNDDKHAWPQVKVTQKGVTRLGCIFEGASEDEGEAPITLHELNGLAVDVAKAIGPHRVLPIIESFGAPRLAGIDTDKYPDLKAALIRAAVESF